MITDTAKSKYKRVCTIATECLHTVFTSALQEKYQDEWFNQLLKQGKFSSSTNNIYSILLADLLRVLSSDSEVSTAVFAKADKAEGLKELCDNALKLVKELNVKPLNDYEAEKYLDAAKVIADVIDRFSSIRNEEGVTYISKILNRIYSVKNEEKIPTYSVKATIEKYKLNISEAEFITCCVEHKIPIVYEGNEYLFKTKDYDGLKAIVSKRANNKGVEIRKQNNKKTFIKVMAVVVAVFLIFVSSSITNSITKATLTKNNDSNDSSSNIFDFLNSDTSSAETDSTESNNEIPPVIHQNGRTKESFEINYIYDGNFKMLNPNLGDVYMHLSKFEYGEYSKEYSITYIVYNKSEKAIRNIGFEITVLNEQKQVVFTHTVDKVISNGNSISVTAGSSHWLNVDVPEDAIYIKNPDLGFCTFKVDLYYDIIE